MIRYSEQDNVRVIKDKNTGESRGFAFVDFEHVGGVATAQECMEKTKARTNTRSAVLSRYFCCGSYQSVLGSRIL